MLDALGTARRIALEEGGSPEREVLAGLAALPREQVGDLLTLADEVRRRASGDAAAVEVLFNAKKGGCSEDCHFCSQSARYATNVVAEPLRATHEFLEAAREARARGAAEFCIVVAVRGPSPALVERVGEATRAIRADMPEMHVAVSLGILTDAHCTALADSGVHKINHNLETSRRHFPAICTTHSYDERWETCLRAKRHGFELCSGGIIGMGETPEDRLDFLCALQELGPVEVPINFLNPRPGTPLADRSVVDPVEALRFVAMARLALPQALVRLAGGREITLQGLQDLGMRSGASGIVLGAYLTTSGRDDGEDFAMLERTGFRILNQSRAVLRLALVERQLVAFGIAEEEAEAHRRLVDLAGVHTGFGQALAFGVDVVDLEHGAERRPGRHARGSPLPTPNVVFPASNSAQCSLTILPGFKPMTSR